MHVRSKFHSFFHSNVSEITRGSQILVRKTTGDYVIVGADGHDDGGLADTGAAYIFRKSAGSWNQEAVWRRRGNGQRLGKAPNDHLETHRCLVKKGSSLRILEANCTATLPLETLVSALETLALETLEALASVKLIN